jgi:hypothetical protein
VHSLACQITARLNFNVNDFERIQLGDEVRISSLARMILWWRQGKTTLLAIAVAGYKYLGPTMRDEEIGARILCLIFLCNQC